MVILNRFGDISGFCAHDPILILGVFPLHQIAHVGVNVSRCLTLFGREIISKYSSLCDHGTWTDRRRDRRRTVA